MNGALMNKNDWIKSNTPSQVLIVCENNNKALQADVLALNERTLVAAIQGVKVNLISRHENGVYVGKMGGLDLVYRA
jgi:hypothetical protein